MLIQVENLKYHVKIKGRGTPIFALHGFAQNSDTWNLFDEYLVDFENSTSLRVPSNHFENNSPFEASYFKNNLSILQNFFIICIDLVGHGKSDKPENIESYLLKNILRHLHSLIHEILKRLRTSCVLPSSCDSYHGGDFDSSHTTYDIPYILLGYSLGGRIALNYAIQYQEELLSLILESTSYGIFEEETRKVRKESDYALANKIILESKEKSERIALENFHEYWSHLPIFSTQKKLSECVLKKIKENRLHNVPHALANTLKATSQGVLPSVREKISEILIPTLYISGELDKKYTQIGKELIKLSKYTKHTVLQNTGHNTHLENPDLFINALVTFLENLTKSTEKERK